MAAAADVELLERGEAAGCAQDARQGVELAALLSLADGAGYGGNSAGDRRGADSRPAHSRADRYGHPPAQFPDGAAARPRHVTLSPAGSLAQPCPELSQRPRLAGPDRRSARAALPARAVTGAGFLHLDAGRRDSD